MRLRTVQVGSVCRSSGNSYPSQIMPGLENSVRSDYRPKYWFGPGRLPGVAERCFEAIDGDLACPFATAPSTIAVSRLVAILHRDRCTTARACRLPFPRPDCAQCEANVAIEVFIVLVLRFGGNSLH